MCFFLVTVFLGPRAAIVFWWLIAPGRWDSAFDTFILPVLGFIFLPWTTLTFVAVAPNGVVSGDDWVWLGLGFFLDLLTSGFGYRSRTQVVYR